MGLKHFVNFFNKEQFDEIEKKQHDKEFQKKIIDEGRMLSNLTKQPSFNIIKQIISELEIEYIEKATNDKDYAPMYGRESLKRLLEIIDIKIKEANSYLEQES
jgi:hypothetical protein